MNCTDAIRLQETVPPLIGLSGIILSVYNYTISPKSEHDKNIELMEFLSITALTSFIIDTIMKSNKSISCNLTI
jgi:hypothetical protein